MKVWAPWVIVLILFAVVWKLTSVLIALENRTYASEVGLCYEATDYTNDLSARNRREKCLARTQTRTSNWWHLWYALGR